MEERYPRIEPHQHLLTLPPKNQSLFKIMSVENLITSINEQYLHFQRVDCYSDFPNADRHDGEQLKTDRLANKSSSFEKAPYYHMADYYDKCRKRTYACCFSLENSYYIWQNYAKNNTKGKICLVFDFEKLRLVLNHIVEESVISLKNSNSVMEQFFAVNYGNIKYISWSDTQMNQKLLRNFIEYVYLKDLIFSEEKEHRISLSVYLPNKFVFKGKEILFPESIRLGFDFIQAVQSGVISNILISPDYNYSFLFKELKNYDLCIRNTLKTLE